MKNKFIGIIRVAMIGMMMFVPRTSFAQAVPLSFQEFVQRVLAYYPKIKSARQDVDIALAQEMQAKAGYWPSLNLSLGYDVSNDPVNVFSTLLHQGRFTSADFEINRLNTPDSHQGFSSNIHMDIPLFDAAQTIYRARSARERVKAAQFDESFTRMEALLMAEDAYLSAVTIEQLSLAVDDIWKDSDEDLKKAKELKEKGVILGADYFSARVMLGEFARLKNELARQKAAMMILLNILMGQDSGQRWTLAAALKECADDLPSQNELAEQAYALRADVKALNFKLQSMDMELSRERSSVLPQIHGFADAGNYRDKFDSAGNNNYTVGLRAEMPLFDPSHSGKVKEAQEKKARLEDEIQLYKDQISRDIAEELARYEALQENMSVLKGMTQDAKEAVSLLVPLYDEGRKSIADLFNVRQAYLRSIEAYHKSLMNVWLSKGRLLFLTGQLTEEEMKKLTEGAGL